MTTTSTLRFQVLVCGLGGQGVLFLTKALLEAAFEAGHEVLACETHGMSQRGGSVASHLKIGPFHGPMIEEGCADLVLSVNEHEAYRNLPFLRRGGWMIADAVVTEPHAVAGDILRRKEAHWGSIDATGVAANLGAPLSANLVLMGFALGRAPGWLAPEAVLETVRRLSPRGSAEANEKAFREGLGHAAAGALEPGSPPPPITP